LIVAVVLGIGILIMYNRPQNKSIRRAFSATEGVWDAASPDKRRRLLESAGVPKEKHAALVSSAWQSLSEYVRVPLANLELETEIKTNSIITSAAFGEAIEKYSKVISGRGIKVWDLASSVAIKITEMFNEKSFNEILIKQHHIEKDFNSGWSYQDSLSRWYAIGVICLTRCLMTEQWNDALQEPYDIEVYDASLAFMWISWGMPEAVKAKVNSFMKDNFLEIKASFRHFDNTDTFRTWFLRYGDRLIGANPPWESQDGKNYNELETLLKGETILSDKSICLLISRAFMKTGEEVLKLVSPPRIL